MKGGDQRREGKGPARGEKKVGRHRREAGVFFPPHTHARRARGVHDREISPPANTHLLLTKHEREREKNRSAHKNPCPMLAPLPSFSKRTQTFQDTLDHSPTSLHFYSPRLKGENEALAKKKCTPSRVHRSPRRREPFQVFLKSVRFHLKVRNKGPEARGREEACQACVSTRESTLANSNTRACMQGRKRELSPRLPPKQRHARARERGHAHSTHPTTTTKQKHL